MQNVKGFYSHKYRGSEWQVDKRIPEEFLTQSVSSNERVSGFGEEVMFNAVWTPCITNQNKYAISLNFRPPKQKGGFFKENKLFKALVPPGYNMLYPTSLVLLTSDIDETSRVRAFAFTLPHPRASYLIKAEPILNLEDIELPPLEEKYPLKHCKMNSEAFVQISTHDQVEAVGALHFIDIAGYTTYLLQSDLEGSPRAWERATAMHLVMEKNKAFIPVVEKSSNNLGYLIKTQKGVKAQIQMTPPEMHSGLPNDYIHTLVSFLRENLITEIAKSL